MRSLYTLKMRGAGRIEVNQEGYPIRSYSIGEALTEAARSPDSNRKYVLLRAVETLEGKAPQDWKRRSLTYKNGRVVGTSGVFVDRWAAARAPKASRKKRSRSLLRRIWERVFRS